MILLTELEFGIISVEDIILFFLGSYSAHMTAKALQLLGGVTYSKVGRKSINDIC
jgi:hypothetical protein